MRPHDIEIVTAERPDTVAARVTRLQRVGFEVRVELATGEENGTWVQLTRGQSESLKLQDGSAVWLAVAANSTTLTAPAR